MKAITVKEDNINSPFEDCFGKAKYFCIIEDNPDKIEFVLNPGNDLMKGSGIKAVKYLYKRGVESVMSRNYGVAVKRMLNKHKIQTVIIPQKYESLTQILEMMRQKT